MVVPMTQCSVVWDSTFPTLIEQLSSWSQRTKTPDHIGGLASVLANYKVDTLIWNGEDKETADFLGFYEAIQREQLNGTQKW